jgi:hypothetical protein
MNFYLKQQQMGIFYEEDKPTCEIAGVGEHLQCHYGVRRFKRCIVSVGTP